MFLAETNNSQRVQQRKCPGRSMEMAKWYRNGTETAFYQNPSKPQSVGTTGVAG